MGIFSVSVNTEIDLLTNKHMKRWSMSLVIQFSSVQSLSRVLLFATLWSTARQASLSITNSRSSPKPISIELVMPSNRIIILCHPLLLLPSIFPSIGSFQMNQLFASGGQSIEVSASTSVLPMNIQGRFPLGLTGLISCCPMPLGFCKYGGIFIPCQNSSISVKSKGLIQLCRNP